MHLKISLPTFKPSTLIYFGMLTAGLSYYTACYTAIPNNPQVNINRNIQDTDFISDNYGFENVMPYIFKEEGGYNPNDGNGYPVKYGINGKYYSHINIKSLTKKRAKQIYKNDYWNAINGDALLSYMQVIAMDSAVNQGVNFTKKALSLANNDLMMFYNLRKERYYKIYYQNKSKKKYLRVWLNRLERIKNISLKIKVDHYAYK